MRELPAPMDGQVKAINVRAGDEIKKNETVLAVMDVMKMEIPVYAEEDGAVKEVKVQEGDSVQQGDALFMI